MAHPSKTKAYKEHKKQPAIDAFIRTGTKLRAAQAVNINRDTIDEWIRNDPEFAAKWTQADLMVTEDLEDKAIEQAKDGDTALLIFLLKCRNPAKYTERFRHEIVSTALSRLIGLVSSLLRRAIPDSCPACRTNLQLKPRIAKELIALSDQMESTVTSVPQEAA